jgi:hypothetical protein
MSSKTYLASILPLRPSILQLGCHVQHSLTVHSTAAACEAASANCLLQKMKERG